MLLKWLFWLPIIPNPHISYTKPTSTGREHFPVYDIKNNTTYTANWTIVWSPCSLPLMTLKYEFSTKALQYEKLSLHQFFFIIVELDWYLLTTFSIKCARFFNVKHFQMLWEFSMFLFLTLSNSQTFNSSTGKLGTDYINK